MYNRIGATTRRSFPAGFTLIELMISIAIIAMLTALLLAVLNRTRESVRRATDLSNLHQLTTATLCYAQQNDSYFPPGRVAAGGADDYTWMNYAGAWEPLEMVLPNLKQIDSCQSVREGYLGAAQFGVLASNGYSKDVRAGWVYWAGRDDLWAGTVLKYRSLRRLTDRLTPGSQTLWTCLCWDSAGNPGPSVCPHVGNNYVEYPSRVTLSPPPDGLGVALIDGSASFVGWGDLGIVSQANGYKLYYQP